MIPSRVTLAFLCACGVMELYMTRTNLSIAIVAMVQTVSPDTNNTDQVPKLPYCLRNTSELIEDTSISNLTSTLGNNIGQQISWQHLERPQMKMTSIQRGNVLSALFYGCWITAAFGGQIADIFGMKRTFGAALLVDTLGTFLIPVAAKISYKLLFLIRFIMGLFQGACFPALFHMTSDWFPPKEVSRFISFTIAANSFGTVFTLTTCGFIISKFGWEYVFNICGCISLMFFILWKMFMFDNPEEHPRISEEEKSYILKNRDHDRERLSGGKIKKFKNTPWRYILTSRPFWATTTAHAGNFFCLNIMITQLPTYMSSIQGLNIKDNGLLSSLPFIARFIGSNIFSWGTSFLMKYIQLRPKTWKILITIISFGGPAVCLLMVGYIGCNVMSTYALFIIGMTLNGSIFSGYLKSNFELSPSFAGTVNGISTSVAYVFGMLSPVTVGFLTPEETSEEWFIVFLVVFAVYVISGLIYCIFISTDVQPWNWRLKKADTSISEDPEELISCKNSPKQEENK